MSAPVLSWLFTVQGTPKHSSHVSPRRTRVHHPPGASSSLGSARPSVQGSLHPTLRANPFPEVTDLFCRLPLPTLFYRPEAFHLGDLLRIWVRLCTKFTHLSSRFSRANASASNGTRPVPLLVVAFPISGQTDSREHTFQDNHLIRKDNSLRNLRQRLWIHLCCHTSYAPTREGRNIALSVAKCGIINPLPFRTEGDIVQALSHFRTELTYSLGSTDPCSTAVHMEPFSTSAFKVLI